MRLGLIVESQLKEYDEFAHRQDKTKLAEKTMATMQQAGVRFLTRTNGYWELAADRMARDRVSTTFRTVRDRLRVANTTTAAAHLADDANCRVRKRIEHG